MENPDKPLDAEEIVHYRRYARGNHRVLTAGMILTVAMHWNRIGLAVSTAIFLSAILVAMELVLKIKYLSS